MTDNQHCLRKWEAAAEAECRRVVSKAFVTGELTFEALGNARTILSPHLADRTNHYSSFDWLLFLRTEPVRSLFAWLNDGLETAHIAESFSSNSTKASTDSQRLKNGVRPVLNESRYRRIAQFVGESFVWRQLHVFNSLLAMDIPVIVRGTPPFPIPEKSPEQNEALEIYNHRVHSRPMMLATGGAIAASTGEDDLEDTTFVCVGIRCAGGFEILPLGLRKFQSISELGIIKADHLQEVGDLLLSLKVGYIIARTAAQVDQVKRFGLFCGEAKAVPSWIEGLNKIAEAIERMIPTWNYVNAEDVVRRLLILVTGRIKVHHCGSNQSAPPLVEVF